MTVVDLAQLVDIDGTIESSDYLHVERSGEEMSLGLRVERRPLREKSILRNPIADDLKLTFRQIVSGADEGIALVAEHAGQIVAAAIAQPRPERGVMELLDIRVDYDVRREGLASAMMFQIIQQTRQQDLRAVFAETRSNNFPANQLLLKLGFDLSGVDVRRQSNHDMVKEIATLFWYAALD